MSEFSAVDIAEKLKIFARVVEESSIQDKQSIPGVMIKKFFPKNARDELINETDLFNIYVSAKALSNSPEALKALVHLSKCPEILNDIILNGTLKGSREDSR
ncbi:MAG: hypothetical protein LBJ93_01500 [Clostridiales bacterium]|jgi:hypothetical protein|nr:hypothetical protein [Clostridiales bacterium]